MRAAVASVGAGEGEGEEGISERGFFILKKEKNGDKQRKGPESVSVRVEKRGEKRQPRKLN